MLHTQEGIDEKGTRQARGAGTPWEPQMYPCKKGFKHRGNKETTLCGDGRKDAYIFEDLVTNDPFKTISCCLYCSSAVVVCAAGREMAYHLGE